MGRFPSIRRSAETTGPYKTFIVISQAAPLRAFSNPCQFAMFTLEDLSYRRVLLDSFVVVAIVVITSIFTRASRIKRAGERLPPGPAGHWLFGNTLPRSQYAYTRSTYPPANHSASICSVAFHYTELGKTHGPVYTLRHDSKYVCVVTGHQVGTVFPSPCRSMLILWQAAIDIMVKQSHKLADRPRYIVAGEILSRGMRILATRAGERLRRLRG